ncbi:hypothetical protein OQI_27715 [Streptomyces pharetrae CZA14]|uniref:Gram-positive cocci surface proteins LPxTG domain-containing protein n=1 Tax=Streptomyces pharetrae CZA14 TaxID=1144883 RepID=A0ABX3YBX0_9ACTN|nr:hypothetical protein OQI_27715 [Streptomyces pharetrae CZA14]
MRSARMLVAVAGASAALALGAPGAYAAVGSGSDHEDSSYSKEHEKEDGGHDSGYYKDGGHDSGSYKDGGHDSGYKDEHDKGSWKEKDSWGGDHEKPRGGVHTGGGALAGPSVTAGGMAVLAVAGTGLYAMRRRKTAEGAG